MAVQNRCIQGLRAELTLYRRGHERLDYYFFQENIFRLRYAAFTRITAAVFEKSNRFGFNPYLIMALIQVESGFNAYAVSSHGAFGLMQVNYAVWKDELHIDGNRIFDVDYNVELGLKILSHYYQKTKGNMFLALLLYNNGSKPDNTAYFAKSYSYR